VIGLLVATPAHAQRTGRAFDLATLQQSAIDTDPRSRELQLYADQSALRLRNISTLRLPTVMLDSQAQ
jgi:hypothetical protein